MHELIFWIRIKALPCLTNHSHMSSSYDNNLSLIFDLLDQAQAKTSHFSMAEIISMTTIAYNTTGVPVYLSEH